MTRPLRPLRPTARQPQIALRRPTARQPQIARGRPTALRRANARARQPQIAVSIVVAATLALAACSDSGPSLSLDDLREAGDTCPVDPGDALPDAGLDDEAVEVEVIEGSGEGDADASAIDRVGGVFVTCTWRSDDASLVVETVGVESGEATALFLPALLADLRISTDELDRVAEDVASTDEGTRVDLGPEATVALAPIEVDGAASGAVFVSGDGAPAAAAADAVLEGL